MPLCALALRDIAQDDRPVHRCLRRVVFVDRRQRDLKIKPQRALGFKDNFATPRVVPDRLVEPCRARVQADHILYRFVKYASQPLPGQALRPGIPAADTPAGIDPHNRVGRTADDRGEFIGVAPGHAQFFFIGMPLAGIEDRVIEPGRLPRLVATDDSA